MEDLDALACDCRYGLQIVGWPDHVEDAKDAAGELVISFG